MANINTSLDILRRNALSVILKNADIKFTTIKNKLTKYIENGSSSFLSLADEIGFNPTEIASSNTSATFLLAYTDFFSAYVLMYSSYIPVFKNLKNISSNKYEYIFSVYKRLAASIKEKEKNKDNLYVVYSNFLDENKIDKKRSGVLNREDKVSSTLGYNGICTLPTNDSSVAYPTNITYFSDDGSLSSIDSTSGKDFLTYNLLRQQGRNIGIVDKSGVKSLSDTNKGLPDVKGTIFGYFSDTIYVKVTSIEFAGGVISQIGMKGSVDNVEWSSEFFTGLNEEVNILIDDDLELGLTISFKGNFQVATGNFWSIGVKNLRLDSPSLDITIDFNILEPVSFIKFLDTSEYMLDISGDIVDRNKFSSETFTPQVFNSRISHIVATEGEVNTYKISAKQTESEVYSYADNVYNKFNFDISGIEAYCNKYGRHGSLAFSELEVENINTVTVETSGRVPEYIPHRIDYTADQEDQASKISMPKSYTELNVAVIADSGNVIIPVLDTNILIDQKTILVNSTGERDALVVNSGAIATVKDDATYVYYDGEWNLYTQSAGIDCPVIFESVIPENVFHDETYGDIECAPATYTTRFPVDNTYDIKDSSSIVAYDSNSSLEVGYVFNEAENNITITQYFMKDAHTVFYPVKLYTVLDSAEITLSNKWTKASASIYYMYYKDENRKVHTAIRKYNKKTGELELFTGTICGQIEMRSSDDSYKTPMVFEYTLGIL